METRPLQLSVAVFAHNEEGTVADCIASIAASRTHSVHIAEVLVVSSGSTDRTDERAHAAMVDHPHMRLLRQSEKRGKASAINLFLAEARESLCVFTNADTILHEEAVENLCRPLRDRRVGMVGGHPVPVMTGRGGLGFAIEVFWELHHELCLLAPKMGELVAFRRTFAALEGDEAGADEDWIHSEVAQAGLEVRYAPDAVLYNRGPSSLRDFLAHRRRMAVQHRELARQRGFAPSSRDRKLLARALRNYLRDRPDRRWALPPAALLEGIARLAAIVEHDFLGRTQSHWRPLRSSKGLTRADVERFRRERE